jgi:The GLUG motif/Listeria-Bacteroides repeat domain (List_Bact_rpt)
MSGTVFFTLIPPLLYEPYFHSFRLKYNSGGRTAASRQKAHHTCGQKGFIKLINRTFCTIIPSVPQRKRLSLILIPVLMLLLQGCYDFDNPVDPNSDNYQGFRSERDDPVPDIRVVYHANTADIGSVPVDAASYFPGDTATVLGKGTLDHSLSTGFLGWNTAHDGSGTGYLPGATLVLPTYNIVLYAQWDGVSTYKVDYYSNGATDGSAPWDGNTYLGSDILTAPGPGSMVLLQDGISLRFAGWDTLASGTGTRYDESATFTLASNLDLYAQWDVIGGIGPAGGLVFYDKGSVSDGWRYLEAAPASTEFFISWGDILLGEVFAVETIIGGGRLNTLRTAALTGNWNGGNYAAMQAELLLSGGFDDWFLPSRDELLAMHDELHIRLLGGFSNVVYWSSTEAGATGGTTMDFSTGSLNSEGKDVGERARAARSFRTIEPTYGVLYLANGADAGAAPVDYYHYEPSETANLANEGSLVKADHYFAGWNSAPDGSGTAYIPGESVGMAAGNLVLYADWVPFFAGGDGNPGNPYQIDTPEGLDAIRLNLAAEYELIADIDLNVSPYNSGLGWEPIGGSTTPFTGILNGNSHRILNLYINRVGNDVGLFGMTNGAFIEKVGLENVDVTGTGQNVGALAGRTDSLATDNYFDNYAMGTVTGGDQTGGLIGRSAIAVIKGSFADVTVNGANMVGGLVGYSTADVADSYATGDVSGLDSVGGLVGNLFGGSVLTSYAAGFVSGLTNRGGLAGLSSGVITDSYYDTDTTGQSSLEAIGLATALMLDSGNFGGWDFATIWQIDEGVSYPYLQWQGGANIPFS